MALARPVCKTVEFEKSGDSGSGRVLRRHVSRLPQRNTDAAPLWRHPRLATYRPPAMATPTPADLVILSTRVVTPEGTAPAAVAISDGVVTAIHDHGAGPDSPRRLDVADAVLLPGGVDTHVHVNEPGRTEWEGFETATRAAAGGGITTIVDMPLNSVPVTTTTAALALKARAAAGHATIDYAFWGGVVPGNIDQLAPLARAGVRGFKCFLVPSGIDEFPPVGESQLRPAMSKLAGLGLPLLVHAELPGPIARAGSSRGSDPRRYGSYLASRPRAAELEAVNLMLGLCRETGCRVHIVHVSAAETLGRLRDARRAGLPVPAGTWGISRAGVRRDPPGSRACRVRDGSRPGATPTSSCSIPTRASRSGPGSSASGILSRPTRG